VPEHYTCCRESRSAHGELCLTVVGIPFGVQCFKIASLGLTPFGKTIDDRGSSPLGFFFNVLWFVLAGLWIFPSHVVLAVGLAISVIGFPSPSSI
jgi:uncharacterized membrane protein YccF (DUF307 family)